MLFSGASAAAPRWPITSGRPSPRRTITPVVRRPACGRDRRRTRGQIPNVVWISRQAVSAKTTVRKMSTASTTQKRAFELRAAFCALAARVPARPLAAVRALDRRGIERGGVVVPSLGARRRLGHRRKCRALPGAGSSRRIATAGTDVRRRLPGRSDRPKPHTSHRAARLLRGPERAAAPTGRRPPKDPVTGIWGSGDRIVWLAALILTLSTLMGWYSGDSVGVKLAVIGWNTGVLGKLVFFIGFATLAIVILREFGVELPASLPESLVILALGALATVFVLIRVIYIPDDVLPADGRGIGLWISLLAALGVIVGGLLRAVEEL